MNKNDFTEWLKKTKDFWSPTTLLDAKFGLIYVDTFTRKILDEEELEKLWDNTTERDTEKILNGMSISKTSTVMDVGCGIGRIMKPMSQKVKKVVGVDVSGKMIGFAKEYLKGINNIELFVNDGNSFPEIQSESIDFVYSMTTFQHMSLKGVIENNIKEISRVLKPGGKLKVQTRGYVSVPHGLDADWKRGDDISFAGAILDTGLWDTILESSHMKILRMTLNTNVNWLWIMAEKNGNKYVKR